MSRGGKIAFWVITGIGIFAALILLPLLFLGGHYKCIDSTYPCKYYPWQWHLQGKSKCNSTCGLCASWCSDGDIPSTTCADKDGNSANCCTINPGSCSGCHACKKHKSPIP